VPSVSSLDTQMVGSRWIVGAGLSKLYSIGYNVTHVYAAKTKKSTSLSPLGERGDRKAEGAPRSAGGGGEGVGPKQNTQCQGCVTRNGSDPLTRLAPADEYAGCEPPSPPRGRGK
jgi:hypothetical protein